MIFGTGRPRAAFCLASGPSLTAEDVSIVRQWRGANTTEERRVVVVNTTFRAALWADAMYASNDSWWRVFGDEVAETFRGDKFCHADAATAHAKKLPRGDTYGCSGATAVAMCLAAGADRVIMLGHDACALEGKLHWHEDYEQAYNAHNIGEWPEGYLRLRAAYARADVLNCSRRTALNMFPTPSLEKALLLPAQKRSDKDRTVYAF